MQETKQPATDKQAYTILLGSGLISEDKCKRCGYAPILNWYNYCPMCAKPTK